MNIFLINLFISLFDNNYMPHGACYFWEPTTLWSNVLGDGVTSFSYFMIPGMLIYFIKKRKDIEVNPLLVAFSVFIIACGLVHFLAIINVWNPLYDISGILKVLMALVSVGTVILLWKSMPELLKIPSPAQLQSANNQISLMNINLEKMVEKRTAELEEINKELESFSYSISHDLQIPIRGIHGYSSILKEEHGDQLGENGLETLEKISGGALKMNALVQGILEFIRLGKKEINLVSINMELMFRNALEDIRVAMKTPREISMTIDPLPEIYADKQMMKQLVTNVLSNAVKYAEDFGVIDIKISAQKEKEEVVFFVKDKGIGFDENYKSKMFEVFQRLHDDELVEGTGVGLAIVRRIIERHHGKVDAFSNEEETVIQFSIGGQG